AVRAHGGRGHRRDRPGSDLAVASPPRGGAGDGPTHPGPGTHLARRLVPAGRGGQGTGTVHADRTRDRTALLLHPFRLRAPSRPDCRGPVMSGVHIRRVGVVGGGQMGAGISEVCARSGLDTIVCEATRPAAEAARERIAVSLERAVQRGKLDRHSAETALGRVTVTAELADLADRQLVVEAVTENAEAKAEVFAALDKVVADPQAILATNTSSLPVMRLGMATGRADRVVGLHFFNPVPVLPLVEVVTTLHTSAATATAVHHFATRTLGKTVIRSTDRAGFVVNALLIPYLLS